MSEWEHGNTYPTRCLHAAIDAESYSGRTSLPQRDMQERVQAVLHRAAEAIGFGPARLWFQPQGDGGTIRFPAGIDEAAALVGLMRELRVELEAVNRDLIPAARVRLRLAFVVGVSQPAALGLAGDPPVAVNRLLNAQELRARLAAAPEASLAVIIPNTLFQDLVVHRLRGLDPVDWEQIHVVDTAKKFDSHAWMTVPGGSAANTQTAVPTTPTSTSAPVPVPAAGEQLASASGVPVGSIGSIGSIGNVAVFNERVDIKEGGLNIG